MKSLDERIRRALVEIREKAHEIGALSCPDEELLAQYLDGTLAGPERDRVESHLRLCPECLDIVRLEAPQEMQAALAEASARLRPEMLERAKAIVPTGPGDSAFDLVVRWARDGLQVIRSTLLEIPVGLQPSMIPVRGEGPPSPEDRRRRPTPDSEGAPDPGRPSDRELLRRRRIFEGVLAEVVLAVKENIGWKLFVLLKDPETGESLSGIRVTLKHRTDGKVIDSVMDPNGLADFESIGSGEYLIELTRDGQSVGTIDLSLTGDGS